MTLNELAVLVGGQFSSGVDGSVMITGAAALDEASAGDVTFYNNPKYLLKLRSSGATVALVPEDFAEDVPPICIRCKDPTAVFSKVVQKLAPPPVAFRPGIHPTAVIGEGVTLGENVSVQPYAVIEDGATIGDRTVVGAHSYIGHKVQVGADCILYTRVSIEERCLVGDRVILHCGVVLGSDGFGYEFKDGRYVKVPQVGIVQIDDDVEIGANSSVDRARFGRTWVKEGAKIDNLVQIGHNVVVGKHTVICALAGIAGSVKIGDYVTLAGQVGVSGHLEIGDKVTVGGHAGVTKSIGSKRVVMGFPAVDAKEWKQQVVFSKGLPRLARKVKAIEQLLGESGISLPPES